MAQQKTFRTAFNGFNREDVVRYIEYMNAKHLSECNQLNSELEFLRGKLAQVPQPSAQDPQALARCAELEAKLAAALEEKAQAEAQRDAAQAAQAQAEAALAEAKAQQTNVQCRIEQELEAYRRAERAERVAKERAEKVYNQVNGVLGDATVKVDDAASRIGGLTDQVMAQLNQLQEAMAGSKQALQEAADVMYNIRPSAEEE